MSDTTAAPAGAGVGGADFGAGAGPGGAIYRHIPDNPPEGFKRIDFQQGAEVVNYNTHVGSLYYRRGAAGTADHFVMGLRVQSWMCNPAGTLHGGMMMTVADLIGGMGAMFVAGIRGKFAPTISMTFDFVAPAREGDWVEGRLDLFRRTRSMLFSHVWLSAGDTRILRASCIVKLPSTDNWTGGAKGGKAG